MAAASQGYGAMIGGFHGGFSAEALYDGFDRIGFKQS
jgi:hypothetical protein